MYFLFYCVSAYYIPPGNHINMTLNNFTFGSCFYGRLSTKLDIFDAIQKENPQLWMWLGDAAYVDKIAFINYWNSDLKVNFTLAEEIFDKVKKNECKMKNYLILYF